MSRDFWSRRREGVAAEDAALEAEALEVEQADKTDAELLEDLDLPDPDTLGAGDDFSAFMAKAVPDHLRRRALRTLWRSNPVLANIDGLVDYGQDFTDKAMAVENIQTAYQVGKGMLKHVQEMARQAEALAAEDAPEDAQDWDEPEIEEPEMILAEAPEPEPTPLPIIEDNTPMPSPTPRRMKFSAPLDAPEVAI